MNPKSVALALKHREIVPDLLHIRYTDNLAKAMLVPAVIRLRKDLTGRAAPFPEG